MTEHFLNARNSSQVRWADGALVTGTVRFLCKSPLYTTGISRIRSSGERFLPRGTGMRNANHSSHLRSSSVAGSLTGGGSSGSLLGCSVRVHTKTRARFSTKNERSGRQRRVPGVSAHRGALCRRESSVREGAAQGPRLLSLAATLSFLLSLWAAQGQVVGTVTTVAGKVGGGAQTSNYGHTDGVGTVAAFCQPQGVALSANGSRAIVVRADPRVGEARSRRRLQLPLSSAGGALQQRLAPGGPRKRTCDDAGGQPCALFGTC